MSWYISSNGNRHEFSSWKEVSQVWKILKELCPGDAVLCRGNGKVIERT